MSETKPAALKPWVTPAVFALDAATGTAMPKIFVSSEFTVPKETGTGFSYFGPTSGSPSSPPA